MRRIIFPVSLCLCLFSCGEKGPYFQGIADLSPASGESVLLILVDDLGSEHIEISGIGNGVPTPALDSLASTGVYFERAWSNPICSPTRVSVQTGERPDMHGVGDALRATEPGMALSSTTIAEAVPDNYRTSYFGKWHAGESAGPLTPNMQGYEHFSGLLHSEQPGGKPESHYDWYQTVNGVTSRQTRWHTSVLVDEAIAWGWEQPFFSIVAPWDPHKPWECPPQELDSQCSDTDSDVSRYRSMVRALDKEVGRLVESLPPGVVVIFVSDNGSPEEVVQPPVRGHKGTAYEGGVRVPLLISSPAAIPHRVSSPVMVGDLFSTVVELTGGSYVSESSISLVPQFYGDEQNHQFLVAERFGSATSIAATDGRFKVLFFGQGRKECYDLQVDPFESNSIWVPSCNTVLSYLKTLKPE